MAKEVEVNLILAHVLGLGASATVEPMTNHLLLVLKDMLKDF